MSGRVLVTGATGFVGRFLVPYLAGHGWSVRAAARHPRDVPRHADIEPVLMPDLAAPIDWSGLVVGITHVIHLAGIAHATSKLPEELYMAVNARAVRDLAIAAREAGAMRMVLLSSVKAQCDAVFPHVVRESETPKPVDPYGRSKLAAERMMAEQLATATMDWVVLRPVLIHGPGVKGNMRALQRLAASRLPLPLAALEARRSILSLGNLASAILHVMRTPAASRRTFLVADPEPVTVPQIIASLRAGMGRRAGLVGLPLRPAAAAAQLVGKGEAWKRIAGDLVVDTSALRATGWLPVETSEQALRAMAAAASDH